MHESKANHGTKRSNPTDRAEYHSEGNATMTLSAYKRNLTHFIVNEYYRTGHSGDGMKRRAPLQRWTQGIFDGVTFPATVLPPVPADPMKLYISLMPVKQRTLTKGCISLFTHTYYSTELDKLSQLVDVQKPLGDREFESRYDPRNTHSIWIKHRCERRIHRGNRPRRQKDSALAVRAKGNQEESWPPCRRFQGWSLREHSATRRDTSRGNQEDQAGEA